MRSNLRFMLTIAMLISVAILVGMSRVGAQDKDDKEKEKSEVKIGFPRNFYQRRL